jgi:hypothetical protein
MENFVKQRSSNQKGFILACVAIMLALLFSLAAAALDAGNMYLWRVRLERAARAGIISGLGYRALRGWQAVYGGNLPQYAGGVLQRRTATDSPSIRTLVERVESVVRENFRTSFADPTAGTQGVARLDFNPADGPSFTATLPPDVYNPLNDSIEITLTYRMPTFLAGRLEGMGIPVGCSNGDATIDNYCTITTTQRAQLAPANIAMVLDTSGSMICEDGDPLCSCRTSTTNPCGSTTNGFNRQVINQLKRAAVNFQSFFNPNRDRIAIIPFNLAARVSRPIVRSPCGGGPRAALPFGNTEQSFRNFLASIIGGYPNDGNPLNVVPGNLALVTTGANDCPGTTEVRGLTPVSNTNPCDGLIRAADELRTALPLVDPNFRLASPNRAPLSVVFFTDGAPNAMRAAFNNPAVLGSGEIRTQVVLNQQAPVPCGGGNINSPLCNDWYQYSVEWRDTTSPNPFRGPGPLVHGSAGGALFNFQITVSDVVNADGSRDPITYPMAPTYNPAAIICGENRSNRNQFEVVLRGNPTPPDTCTRRADNTIRYTSTNERCGCLNSLDFALPTLSPVSGGAYTPLVTGVPFSERYTRTVGATTQNVDISSADQLHYYCAIEAADWIRMNLGAQVYTVGLGQTADWCGDPLQDADNHFRRKDFFLSRLAYSPASVTQASPPSWNSSHRFSPRRAVTMDSGGTCAAHRFNQEGLNQNQMLIGYNVAGTPGGERQPGQLPRDTQGQYFAADTAAQLNNLFTQIAKQILLRLGS